MQNRSLTMLRNYGIVRIAQSTTQDFKDAPEGKSSAEQIRESLGSLINQSS